MSKQTPEQEKTITKNLYCFIGLTSAAIEYYLLVKKPLLDAEQIKYQKWVDESPNERERKKRASIQDGKMKAFAAHLNKFEKVNSEIIKAFEQSKNPKDQKMIDDSIEKITNFMEDLIKVDMTK